MKRTIEESLRERILYIGNEIPLTIANDPRDKFVLLGYPQQVIDETAPNPRSEAHDKALKYLERLVPSVVAKHYPEAKTWVPLKGDLVGLISQLDNAITGLVRPTPRIERLIAALETIATMSNTSNESAIARAVLAEIEKEKKYT